MHGIAQILSEKHDVNLSDESSDRFNDLLVRKEYKKEDVILMQGEICKDVYIIGKGMVRAVLL